MTSTSRRSRVSPRFSIPARGPSALVAASLFLALGVKVALAADPPIAGAPRTQPADAAAFESEPPDEVVFMGYNLKNYLRMGRSVDGERVEDAPKPEAEIAAVITMILKGMPDILGLVEIGTMEDIENLQGRLRAHGLDLPHATINRSFDSDRRVALISRFPIVATNHQSKLSFQLGKRAEPFRRGILDATVQITASYQLRALGVHFKSKRATHDSDQALIRRHEAHLTRRHAVAILREAPETNLILFGDFNDTRNEAPIRAIRRQYGSPGYLGDVRATDPQGTKWTYYWDHADQYSRFDYLFVNRGIRREVVQAKCFIVADPVWDTASDHRPVVVTIISKNL